MKAQNVPGEVPMIESSR